LDTVDREAPVATESDDSSQDEPVDEQPAAMNMIIAAANLVIGG
jgi:hypothetical protein